MNDNDIRGRIRDGAGRIRKDSERDLSEMAARLQSQVNELVERVTGIKQIKRQYLTLGLTVGVLVGIVLGIIVGMLMQSVNDEH